MTAKKRPALRKIGPLEIESQQTVAEVHTKSIEIVRLSRVKYEGNDLTFIDLRVFQRGWVGDIEIYHPTKRGVQVKESDFLEVA